MKSSAQPLVISVDENLRLREIAATDAPAIFNLIDSNRNYLREWLPFVDYTKAVSDTEAFILTVTAEANFSDLVFIILYKGQPAGIIGFKGIDLINLKLEIGYWLVEAQQNKGIMIRSCRALVKHAFKQLKMNRIQIKVAVENQRSKKIPLKLDFKKEGVQREGELGSSGEFYDLEVYSLLKREWMR